jgi:hypothetical protein
MRNAVALRNDDMTDGRRNSERRESQGRRGAHPKDHRALPARDRDDGTAVANAAERRLTGGHCHPDHCGTPMRGSIRHRAPPHAVNSRSAAGERASTAGAPSGHERRPGIARPAIPGETDYGPPDSPIGPKHGRSVSALESGAHDRNGTTRRDNRDGVGAEILPPDQQRSRPAARRRSQGAPGAGGSHRTWHAPTGR